MEYPFKLSEVIAGCESGAWLEGAVFKGNKGSLIGFDGECIIVYNQKIKENFNFSHYEDDL